MSREEYLELVGRLNTLIDNELMMKEELRTLATKTTQENDGMPHAPGTSDKVGNVAVKIRMKEQEIDHIVDVFVDLSDEIRTQVLTLPVDEADVLYKYYLLNMTLVAIADKRGQSTEWIKKLKNRGVSKVKIIESEAYKETCKLLKI